MIDLGADKRLTLMIKKLATATLALTVALGAQAQQKPVATVMPQDQTRPTPRLNAVQERAQRLSDQMAKELRLNGYQATKLRAINEDKVAKMAAIEQQHAGNPTLIEEKCKGVCKERDKELTAVLSTNQYSDYYSSRSSFYKYDKDYAATASDFLFVNSVKNPLPANSKGATIGPAKTNTPTRSASSSGNR
jgi:hypothetical protein